MVKRNKIKRALAEQVSKNSTHHIILRTDYLLYLGNPRYIKSPFHRYHVPLVSVRRLSILRARLLHGRRILPGITNAARQVPFGRACSLLCRRSRSSVGILAFNGLHLPGSQARKSVTRRVSLSPELKTDNTTCVLVPPDILLHQSGHIMLSDFDLSKSGSEPGGAPAGMKQNAQNGVSLELDA